MLIYMELAINFKFGSLSKEIIFLQQTTLTTLDVIAKTWKNVHEQNDEGQKAILTPNYVKISFKMFEGWARNLGWAYRHAFVSFFC